MLIASFLAAAAAQAAPVYLRCTFPTAPEVVAVATDEANGAVTVSLPSTGYAERLPAAFTVGSLSFNNGVMRVAIDRSKLSAIRVQRDGGGTANGTCAVEAPPERKF